MFTSVSSALSSWPVSPMHVPRAPGALLCVFDLIMADSAQGLHEHHNRRNSGPRDFGGVVQRPGGHSMTDSGRLTNSFLTQIERARVKRHGLDVPDSRPIHCAAFFLSRNARWLRALHDTSAARTARIEVALIERRFAAADDRGDDSRKGLQRSHGTNSVRMLLRDWRGFPAPAWPLRPGRRVERSWEWNRSALPVLRNVMMSLDTFRPQHHAKRKPEAFEHRSLLDMQFEIGGSVRCSFCASGKRSKSKPQAPQRVFK